MGVGMLLPHMRYMSENSSGSKPTCVIREVRWLLMGR